MEINQNNFKTGIVDSDKPSMVDFYAEWCAPCKAIAPMISTLKEEYNGKINVVKIDVDSNPQLAIEYNIRSIPTLMFFKNGNVIDTIKGTATKSALQEKLNSLI
jgi:thioredoxin 1